MSITKFGKDVNNVQNLPDSPSLTPQELKKIFDKAGIDIKEYINEILIKEIDELLLKKVDKEKGKGLSENDFTDTLLIKLNGIATGANKYIHPTTAGYKHIPSGGSSGQVLKWKANGEVQWGTDNNTTYSNATTTASGLMSSTDKSKLNGIATGATKNIITRGTSTPSGGSNGDIYIQYFN